MHTICNNIKNHETYPSENEMGVPFHEVLYADDTVIFGEDPRTVETLLHLFETESSKFGLKLNYDKCMHMQVNSIQRLKYKDRKVVPKAEEVIYLGANINTRSNPNKEINKRMQETLNGKK